MSAMSKKLTSPVVLQASREVGEYLSLWRRLNGVTAELLAERVGVSRDTVRRMESGDPTVSFGTVLSTCRALGILEPVTGAFDPSSTDYGRLRLASGVPKRVR